MEAEALYAQGLFEFSLVAYHRAARLRPDMREFQFGIQKCTDAIKKVGVMSGTPRWLKRSLYMYGCNIVKRRNLRGVRPQLLCYKTEKAHVRSGHHLSNLHFSLKYSTVKPHVVNRSDTAATIAVHGCRATNYGVLPANRTQYMLLR